MASSLTYQFRQQQHQQQQQQQVDDKHDGITAANLPSPPNSSCGEENAMLTTTAPSPPTTVTPEDEGDIGQQQQQQQQQQQVNTPTITQRRDSLQSHFSTLTLQAISNSLPENYTIDHSSIKASLQQALAATVAAKAAAAAAAAAASATSPLPIPIETSTSISSTTTATGSFRRRGSQQQHTLRGNGDPSSSPYLSSPASVAAATGGLTIRHRRPSAIGDQRKHHHQQHRLLSESPKLNGMIKSSTSLPATSSGFQQQQHRCADCGKVYKHSSCLVKHRWEHSEEWELTSKLPLTKHQQVQMLEAAAILVSMDHSKPLDQPPSQHSGSDMEQDDEVVDILNDDDDDDDVMGGGGAAADDDDRFSMEDDDDDDDESIQVDDDDDDISIEMDQDDSQAMAMDQEQHTFPSMIGSTPAMLPSSFSTNVA